VTCRDNKGKQLPVVTENFFDFLNMDKDSLTRIDLEAGEKLSPQARMRMTIDNHHDVPGGRLRQYSSLKDFKAALLQYGPLAVEINEIYRYKDVSELGSLTVHQQRLHNSLLLSLKDLYIFTALPLEDEQSKQLYLHEHLDFAFKDVSVVAKNIDPVKVDFDLQTSLAF
jgi:hypothetical protein